MRVSAGAARDSACRPRTRRGCGWFRERDALRRARGSRRQLARLRELRIGQAVGEAAVPRRIGHGSPTAAARPASRGGRGARGRNGEEGDGRRREPRCLCAHRTRKRRRAGLICPGRADVSGQDSSVGSRKFSRQFLQHLSTELQFADVVG
jgi:hypothetical protein